jgi:N-acetylmuramoyl-L-alanine amidase
MNGSTDETVDYTTTLFGKWRKDKELAYAVFGDNVNPPKINPPTYGLRTLPAVDGTGTIATRTPYSFASGLLLKSNMPATIAETVFITNTNEANQLADPATYGRQQQIAEALREGIEHYLATH